jgi:tripartite-type tricarboxylate transporter receptor subunit TctC
MKLEDANMSRPEVVKGEKSFYLVWCLGVLVGSVSLSCLSSSAHAAEYPAKTIQIVNPFPPGATTDIVSRLLTDKLSTLLGQQVVVVNKAGGGGAIGMKAVKEAAADGYTVLIAPPPLVQIPLARKDIGFTHKDFTPINLAAKFYFVMVVKQDAPWKSLEEIIAEAKNNPGKLTWGTAGTGTSHHFSLELFKMATGGDLTHVPLGGEGPMATAILGGHVNTCFMTLGTATPHLQAAMMRALAVTSPSRLKELLDVPTTAEKGYPTLNPRAWVVFLVPAKTPPAIAKRLADAFREALRDKEIVGKIEKAGLTVENLGPEEAGKFLSEEHKKWSEVARFAKITPQ